MNSESIKKNPLFCRLIRLRASLTNERNAAVVRHCSTCADCREYFKSASDLETGLRRDAGHMRATAPVGLETRVMNAVKYSQPEQGRRAQPMASWSVAAAALAVVAAVVLFQIQDRPKAEPGATVQDAIAVASELPKQWRETVQPGAVRLLADNPLQAELASVRSDTRSALDFLAMNFLPTAAKGTAADEPALQPRRSS